MAEVVVSPAAKDFAFRIVFSTLKGGRDTLPEPEDPMTHPSLNLLLKQLRDPETDERSDAELLARVARSRDTDALEVLIARHASLVYGVCQRLLPCRADVDDVFQATFLVLLRRAATLRSAGSLGSWLHSIAYRLALRVLASARRQRPLEAGREPLAGRDPLNEISGRELCAVIDEELQRLPEKYRAPVVLCCLENRSREEAARALGWAEGSVKARLQRGRELLRRRLERRGLALSIALLAPLLARTEAPAALLPPAREFLVAQGMSVSARAVRLAETALSGLLPAPLRSLTAFVLLLALVTAGAGLAWARLQAPGASSNPPQTARPLAAPAKEEKPRDALGDPLPDGAVARLGSLRFWHPDHSAPVGFSADGKTLRTRGGDETLRTWEVRTGRAVSARKVPRLGRGVAYSPDGRFAVSAAGDVHQTRTVVTDMQTGKAVLTIPSGWLNGLPQFTRDGKSLVLQLWDGKTVEGQTGDNRIEIWDVEARKKRAAIKVPHTTRPPFLSDDGTLMAYLYRDARAENTYFVVYDLKTGKERCALPGLPPVIQAGFSPDARFLVCTTSYSVAGQTFIPAGFGIWDARTGKKLHTVNPDPSVGLGFAISPDSKLVAVAQEDAWPHFPKANGKVRLYDLTTARELRAIPTPQVTNGPMLFSPDGKLLAVGTKGGPVRLYDVATGKAVAAPAGHIGAVIWCGFSPDGRTLASYGTDHTLRLWEPRSGRLLALVKVERKQREEFAFAGPVVFSPDGKRLILTTDDFFFHVYDAAALKELASWTTGTTYGHPVPLAFSPDGKLLACPNEHSRIWVWDLDAKKRIRRLGNRFYGNIHGLAFTPAARHLVVFYSGPDQNNRHGAWVELWDAETGKAVWTTTSRVHHPRVLALSPDGRLVAAGGVIEGLEIYEVATGELLLRRFGPHRRFLSGIDFSRDSRLVAYTGEDRWLCVYDVAADRELLRKQGHGAEISAVSLAPDGRSVATASNDTTLLVWRLLRPSATDPPPQLEKEELETYWKRLTEVGPGDKTLEAVRMLVDAEGQALALLKERLARPAKATPEHITQLIAGLEERRFADRQKAFDELRRLGAWVEEPLRRALESKPTLESRRQIEELLALLRKDADTPQPRGDMLRACRAVWIAELIGTDEARALLRRWADGPPSARLTLESRAALHRLTQ